MRRSTPEEGGARFASIEDSALDFRSRSADAHVVFVADASSSMASFGNAPAAGMREFLASQRSDVTAEDVELEVRVFSSVVRTVFSGRAHDVRDDDIERCVDALSVGGGTRLYDALGAVLTDQTRLAYMRGTGGGLLVVVLTDGMDTCSKEWSAGGIRDLTAAFKHKGGDVVWMQANLDAAREGAAVGVDEGQTLQVGNDAMAMMGAFRAITCATTRYCTTATQESSGADSGDWETFPHLEFTPLERCKSCPTSYPSSFQGIRETYAYEGSSAPLAAQSEDTSEDDDVPGERTPHFPRPITRSITESVTVRPPSRW